IASSPRFGGIENGFVAQIVWIHCKYISMTNISYIQEIYKDLYLITVHYSLTSASYLDRWPLTLTDIKTEAPRLPLVRGGTGRERPARRFGDPGIHANGPRALGQPTRSLPAAYDR